MQPTQPTREHPLSRDEQVVTSTLLDELRARTPGATIADLVLEKTDAARQVCSDYVATHLAGLADLMLIKSLLATAELQRLGATVEGVERTPEEKALVDVATAPYGELVKKRLIAAYGLDRFEVLAVEAYSDANKKVKDFEGVPNPHFMGTSVQNWGYYADGWDALSSALAKLPSLGDLGLVLTTYRAPRQPKVMGELLEIQKIAAIKPESMIEHGTAVMDMGQLHFLSTAITDNVHWTRAGEVGGLIGITGYSGVYINPFGIQGWLDGAEILYPPRVVTVFEGLNPHGYRDGSVDYPVAHLREISKRETGQAVYRDDKYMLVVARDNNLDATKLKMVKQLETRFAPDAVRSALVELGLSYKGVMYLTLDELTTLHDHLAT
ncbi:hypothetical protein [Saccharothrix sp. NRRL B-16348]|uniref:hypothetical protein n=1 Tax=Saccharothrix sp. NRRL B-16348 TaxID=1415542 RepID=UPI000ADA8CC4|nr:hypothetical protein [Saccharothrix sp. NRRL B-16348]